MGVSNVRPDPYVRGGEVWTLDRPDVNTASVRIDPAMKRTNPKGWADEIDHAHKEIVNTIDVVNGNYKPLNNVIRLDDLGNPSNNKTDLHIPILW